MATAFTMFILASPIDMGNVYFKKDQKNRLPINQKL